MPLDMITEAWNAIFEAIRLPLAGSIDPLTASIDRGATP